MKPGTIIMKRYVQAFDIYIVINNKPWYNIIRLFTTDPLVSLGGPFSTDLYKDCDIL